MSISLNHLKTDCLICKNKFLYLGSHLWHRHKIKSKDYKEKYGLPHNLNLISDEVREKKQIAFNKDRKKYLKNITGEKSKKNQFKKGFNRHNKFYFSDMEKGQLISRLQTDKLKGNCPICKTYFEHLQSHLFNKHSLIFLKTERGQSVK